MTTIECAKKAARRELRARRNALTQAERQALSKAACDRLLAGFLANANGVVGCFSSLPGEIDTASLLAKLTEQGTETALPHTTGAGQPLVFRRYRYGDLMAAGAFGVMEPSVEQAIVEPNILVVPLLGFNQACYRIGYGGGFYDRTITLLRGRGKAQTVIGLAFQCQLFDPLPVSQHDVRLDAIVTEKETLTG